MADERTYTEERYWVAGSLHPDAIVALKAQAKAEGGELGPPWLPSEEGVLYGTVTTTTPPAYRPPLPGPAIRTTPCPLRIWPLFTVLGGVAGLAAVAGVIVR